MYINSIRHFAFLFFVLSAAVLYAQENAADGSGLSPDSLLLKGIRIFQEGYNQWSRDLFFDAHAAFQNVTERSPEELSGYYWKGVAEFYILTQALYSVDTYKDPDIASEYLDKGIDTFRRALEQSDSCAECHALLATLYGIAISRNPFKAVTLGPRVQNHMKTALSLDRDNPRIHYLAGMSYLFTPGFLGGGTDKAIEYLRKSESFFARESGQKKSPTAPQWGYSTALAFLGRAYEARGKDSQAVAYFKKALKINRHDLVAQDGLKRMKTGENRRNKTMPEQSR
ncbi:MAG: tetratricopeptide repeat protein [Chitinivibrionales bacterium]